MAIENRQEQSDNATYHFMDSLSCAIRYTGVILLDLIPHIYDTKRVRQILAEDGQEYEVVVDPQGAQAHAREAGAQEMILRDIFNPAIGKYEVRASEGPNFGTRMQAANQALLQLITQAPNLTPIIGDLILSSSNWPMSDEAAERLKRMVPPQALGAPPPQEIQQLQHSYSRHKRLSRSLRWRTASISLLPGTSFTRMPLRATMRKPSGSRSLGSRSMMRMSFRR